MTTTRTRLAALLAASALAFPAGCGGGANGGTDTATTSGFSRGGPQLINADLTTFDAFVLASADNNRLFADVYAISFDPFSIDRLTTDKRVSILAADKQRVVVAAADQDVDRLAEVNGDGEPVPVSGLERPFAYSPSLRDGVMYFHDAQGDANDGKFRYYSWDTASRTKTLLFGSAENFGSPVPLSNGRFLITTTGADGDDRLAVRSKSGKLRELIPSGDAVEIQPGRNMIALTLVGAGDQFGDKPEALLLLDPETGKKTRVPGLQVVAWNPEGTKLLARRTDAPADSRLVLLDPAKPDPPMDVATVPGLVIYSGTWVRDDVPSPR